MVLKLIKNRSDIGAGTRGSDMGIDALEIAAINADNDFFNRHLYQDVVTHNETIYQKNTNSFAQRIEDVAEQCNRVCDTVATTLIQNFFPIVLSGDHSSALGTISGIKKAYPNKKLGVIWIDAHADIHSPYTSPSGNIHGMPLAAALGLDHAHIQVNEISDDTISHWTNLKNIGVNGPKLIPNHLVYLGLRDFEAAEKEVIEAASISNYTVEQLREQGIQNIITDTIKKLEDTDYFYVSFDVDSLDCDQISFGTGTPVKSGFLPDEINEILQQLVSTNKVICLEIAEINPLLDNKGNKMAETAFQILSNFEQQLTVL
ncbi:MAG: arginase [Bacteroidetes bacterium]|nr:arginase [Bacteroidota bacterium]